jgi:hypothetical protein
MACVRRAWLDLDGVLLPLEDDGGGWVCTSLDLGWPEVREVTNPRPDQDGTDDRSRYFGSRGVSADIQTRAAWGVSVDDVASRFAPYMSPAARPTLHYVLDREGAPERVLTLRGSGYSWPIEGGARRDIQLAWVAADPLPRSASTSTATAWSGSSSAPGRTYNLAYNPSRLYPPGGGAKVDADLVNYGDVAVAPLIRVYGPITAPVVDVWHWRSADASDEYHYALAFGASFVIGSGEYVEVDCERHTATLNGDPTASVVSSILWLGSSWPAIFRSPTYVNRMSLAGGSTAGVTQAVALWHDRYLT